MTKGEIIDLLLIKLNGGRITQDTKIRREDLSVYLSPAINWSLLKQYFISKNEDGISDFPDDFIATFSNVLVKEDSKRDLRYIDLPGTILSLSNNRGIRTVSAMKGDSEFVQINPNDRKHNSYYANSFADITTYFLEGKKIYFLNLPGITDRVLVRMIQSVSDLEDDQEIPIPAGFEPEVIKIMEEFYLGQRTLKNDMQPNNAGVE